MLTRQRKLEEMEEVVGSGGVAKRSSVERGCTAAWVGWEPFM